MALKILQSGMNPLGQFDGLPSIVTATKGGEVGQFTYVAAAGAFAGEDVLDAYVSSTKQLRPNVTTFYGAGVRPVFLIDDGTVGYGTLFGLVVGASVGQQSNGPIPPFSATGAILGPHTATGSGKLTLWDKPGLYGVTLDACDVTVLTGLQPTNTTISGGAALYATSAGLLTPNIGNAVESFVLGRFIDFSTNDSKVTTTPDMVSALNSPSVAGLPSSYSGNLGAPALKPFTQAIFSFYPGI